jgi:hypothetical protein
MAASESEAQRREVVRLWLEYVELANPVCARKIRRLLKYGEIDAAKTGVVHGSCGIPWTVDTPAVPERKRAAIADRPLSLRACGFQVA